MGRVQHRLSIILPGASVFAEAYLLRQAERYGVEAEVIKSPWSEAIRKSTGDFLLFLEEKSIIDSDVFDNYLEFRNNGSYRKLAMIGSTVNTPAKSQVYGYSYSPRMGWAIPKDISTSRESHCVQIAYIGGAVVRRSALQDIDPILFDDDPVSVSGVVSAELWSTGRRIILNPNTTYHSPDDNPAHTAGFPMVVTDDIIEKWDREMIS